MAKIERETTIDFDYPSKMKDVGHFRGRFTIKRRTAKLTTEIKMARARMLAGYKAASGNDDLHFDVMATLANGIEPEPNPNPLDSAAWIDDILDPAIWYALYDRWNDYQDSFSAPEASGAANGQATL